jgi:hypothetical protein
VGSHPSASPSTRRARSSVRCLHLACHTLRRADTAISRARAIKALADCAAVRSHASPLSEVRRRLTVRAPPDCACQNSAVSAIRACLTAPSRSSLPPIRPPHRCFPHVAAPPRLTPKPAAAHRHPLPVYVGAHHEDPPHHRNFGHLHRRDPLHGERSPKHPLATFLSFPPRCRSPEHPPHWRTPPPSQFFNNSHRQEARVSCHLHPLARRVTLRHGCSGAQPCPTSAIVARPSATPRCAPGER